VGAQELFPINEPASTIPKGVVGIRLTSHFHYKYSTLGHREMVRCMFGISRNVSAVASMSLSNFHVNKFPQDLNLYYNNSHNHKSKEEIYPYRFEGINLFTKWRILSLDHQNEHLRFALYNELSYSTATHLDAFPNLMGDQSGAAVGLIITKLYKKFAISINTAATTFFPVKKIQQDTVEFKAGNNLNFNLSIGYLLFPKTYKSYNDLNVNIYLEAQSKVFDRPTISRNHIFLNTENFQFLRKGYLVNLYPGIQFILNSKTRVDFNVELPILTSNNTPKYAMLMINVQRYFY
jgi:hypothetical protein